MSDTPRTDERKASFALDTIRQLERELAAARKGIAKLKEQYTPWWARKRSEIDKLREVTEQRDRLAEALRKCREDSVCHQRRMEDLGYTYAAKESQANSDRAYIALQSLTTNETINL